MFPAVIIGNIYLNILTQQNITLNILKNNPIQIKNLTINDYYMYDLIYIITHLNKH